MLMYNETAINNYFIPTYDPSPHIVDVAYLKWYLDSGTQYFIILYRHPDYCFISDFDTDMY